MPSTDCPGIDSRFSREHTLDELLRDDRDPVATRRILDRLVAARLVVADDRTAEVAAAAELGADPGQVAVGRQPQQQLIAKREQFIAGGDAGCARI